MRTRETTQIFLMLEILVLELLRFFLVLVVVWKCAVLLILIEPCAPAISLSARMAPGCESQAMIKRQELYAHLKTGVEMFVFASRVKREFRACMPQAA